MADTQTDSVIRVGRRVMTAIWIAFGLTTLAVVLAVFSVIRLSQDLDVGIGIFVNCYMTAFYYRYAESKAKPCISYLSWLAALIIVFCECMTWYLLAQSV